MPEQVYLRVRSLAPGGAFVGEIVSSGSCCGMKAFVRYAVPGEEIRAVVTARKEKHIEAAFASVDVPSPLRCRPHCPVFGICGGCDLQHMGISAQREAKRIMVEEFLEVQAGLRPVHGVTFHSADIREYGYRRRVTLHVDQSGRFGFYEHSSHKVISTEVCPISTNAVNTVLSILRQELESGAQNADSIIVEEAFGLTVLAFVMTSRRLPLSDESLKEIEKQGVSLFVKWRDEVLYKSASLPSYFQPGHFSQVNDDANQALIEFVAAHVSSAHVTDLYAGSGNLSMRLAARGKQVTAVELDPYLVGMGRKQAKEHGLSSLLEFTQGSAESAAPNLRGGSDLIMDPPRKGAKDVVGFLRPERTPRVVYVSCFLPALARDLKSLVRSGYEIASVTCIDMFPQTAHVEAVAVLEGR